jgi:hypothetical protein
VLSGQQKKQEWITILSRMKAAGFKHNFLKALHTFEA